MFDGRTVSVVFPAYNEEASIGEAVRSFLALDEVDEIVVVDNNSRDRTAELASVAGGRVVTETKQGYGHALQRGLAEATGDLVVMAEPDGTFIAEDVRKLLAYVDNADLVLGTRTTREMVWAGANMGFMLRWGNWGVAKLLQVLFNTPSLSDCGCTMRLIHKPALERIRGNLTVGSSHFLPEMVILARLAGLTMIEVPVTYRPRRGESKITGSFKTSTEVGVNMVRLIVRYRVSGPQRTSRDA
jgi:glycosyltransferase involved in cell wall biosynthesis